ncbi:hypothetical protein C4561_01800 [candidate division WWE3 bacterium]|uniref:Uncharacterized protein n=1 Tax=candidate division WWE3 bacterium TaxID=2053526 RepID=A0A3A4ZES9_UNCKA|nr:MAG: hypothetical protein C4561_01800 [candidate division WWE3 bacterium]
MIFSCQQEREIAVQNPQSEMTVVEALDSMIAKSMRDVSSPMRKFDPFCTTLSASKVLTAHKIDYNSESEKFLDKGYRYVVLPEKQYIDLLNFLDYLERGGGIGWTARHVKLSPGNVIALDSVLTLPTRVVLYENKNFKFDSLGRLLKLQGTD